MIRLSINPEPSTLIDYLVQHVISSWALKHVHELTYVVSTQVIPLLLSHTLYIWGSVIYVWISMVLNIYVVERNDTIDVNVKFVPKSLSLYSVSH